MDQEDKINSAAPGADWETDGLYTINVDTDQIRHFKLSITAAVDCGRELFSHIWPRLAHTGVDEWFSSWACDNM